MIHGNSSSTNIFRDLNLGYTTILPVLLGHEILNNHYNSNDRFDLKNNKRHLIKIINTYKEPILLVGNSLGGHLAIEIASEIKNLKGLIIFGTPPVKKPINIDEAFLPVEALNTFLNEHATLSDIHQAADVAVYSEKHRASIIADFSRTNSKVRAHLAEDIINGNWSDQYNLFTHLDCPKIIVSGDHDPSVNKDYLKKTVENSINNTQLIELEECGHYPTLEQPDKMSKIINDFAAKIFSV